MIKNTLTFYLLTISLCLNVYASEWNKSRNSWGYDSPNDWKERGVNSYEEAKSWNDINIYPSYDLQQLKSLGLFPKDMENWKPACYNSYYKKFEVKCIKEYSQLGLTSQAAYNWEKNVGSPYYTKKWISSGINNPKIAKEWIDVIKTKDPKVMKAWINAGVSTPKEVKFYRKISTNTHTIQRLKKHNLSMEKIDKWKQVGISKIELILKLKDAGFKNPKEYKPYKGMYVDHAAKIKKWNIKPNKLIKNMSLRNSVWGQAIFFNNKSTFLRAYKHISKECNTIEGNKFFSQVDMSMNKNKCYIFVATMIQRLDRDSTSRSGLASGTNRRFFYAQSLNESWMQNHTKIGVIKGTGSFSYESTNGIKVVPKGKVLFLR